MHRRELVFSSRMHQAAELCERWFDVVAEVKREKGIAGDSHTATRFASMIGDEYTFTTTTLGSLESKETSANPDFAALFVRWYIEAGLDSSSTIGLTMSGSFPSLGIAALAAAQTLGADVVVFSSLGASTYGANQPNMTWLDMESELREHGGLRTRSEIVTLGGENDNGGGMFEDGAAMLHAAADRNGVTLYEPSALDKSILRKTATLMDRKIDLLVNIGGNQASLGRCSHASTIPTGLHEHWHGCADEERGIITRLAEFGIPFVHVLNIKDIAGRYGMPISPGPTIAESTALYSKEVVNPVGPIAGIVLVLGLLIGVKVWRSSPPRAVSARTPTIADGAFHVCERKSE